jgi:hypothetical protein
VENMHRTLCSVVGGILFFALAILMMQGSPYNIFYWFLISLPTYFPISHLLYSLLFFICAYVILFVIAEGSTVDDPNNSFKISEGDCKSLAAGATVAFFFILLLFSIPGKKLQMDFSVECYSLFCQSMNKIGYGPAGGLYSVTGLANLLFIAGFPIFMAAVGSIGGAALPTFAAGVVSLSNRHPAEGLVARSLQQFRSDPRAERELLRIMDEQDASDEEVERLLGRLAPWERWYKRIEYRKRARDAKRLREMAELKRQALAQETGLAQSMHGLERTRRRADDRR